MITLPHTGIQVPTGRIRVQSFKAVDVGSGVAWSAVLCNNSNKLGVIANEGRGGPTRLHSDDDKARTAADTFITWCRNQDGAPMKRECVLEALVDEYEISRELASAERRNAYYVRYVNHVDLPGRLTFTLQGSVPPDYEPAFTAAPHLDLPEQTVRAQLWMGDHGGWVEFLRTAHTPE
ncbi:hypothetical protein IDM40_00410 [Nocardiopsis sp. HNM0947]|uniref:Uncharacterized protein n=1 Tax=Nocardiopsis coralli TaxID=2772213 RepID=A0ABR9P012_9ACTN|nr:hypothetical protein [Nocardiopsis coralli]MBE2997167.1 hypothetical protein [Nocardiopsis coralli]